MCTTKLNQILLVLAICLGSLHSTTARPLKNFYKTNFSSGIDPSLDLYIHKDDLDIKAQEIHSLRMQIDVSRLHRSAPKRSTLKIEAYEKDADGFSHFISSKNIMVSKKSKLIDFMLNLNSFRSKNKDIEFKIYDTEGSLINKYHSQIISSDFDPVDETNSSNSETSSKCDNSEFGECQLDYIFSKVIFESKPRYKSRTLVQKTNNGMYKVSIPRAKSNISHNKRKRPKKNKRKTGEKAEFELNNFIEAVNSWGEIFVGEKGIHLGTNDKEALFSFDEDKEILSIEAANGELTFDGEKLLVNNKALVSTIHTTTTVNNPVPSILENKTLINTNFAGSTLISGSLQITSGSPGIGKVLSSDAGGIATWQDLSTLPGAGGDFRNGGEASGADRSLGNDDAFALSFETSDLARLHITAAGDIGIGTSTPASKLDVNGNLKVDDINAVNITAASFSGDGSAITNLNASNINSGILTTARGGTGISNSSGSISFSGNVDMGANDLFFNTIGSTSLNLPLIGTLATLNGIETFSNKIYQNAVFSGNAIANNNLNITGQISIQGGNPGLDKVLVSDAVGLASWKNALTIPGVANDFNEGGDSEGSDRSLGNDDAFALSFETNDTNRLHITAAGDIGIGTNTPATKLDINGDITANDINASDISANTVNVSSISATSVSATNLSGDGSAISNINANNINSGILSPSLGGTGISNNGLFSYGANDITLTTLGVSSLTLPTTGTLSTLDGIETFTNKTLTSPRATGKIDLDGAVVVNESGSRSNLRVEGDNDQNLLFTDSTNDRVGIGTSNPSRKMHIVFNNPVNDPGDNIGLIVENSGNGESELRLQTGGFGNHWTISADNNSNRFRIFEDTSTRFMIQNGLTGINYANGQTIPAKFSVQETNATVASFDRDGSDGVIIDFKNDGISSGSISVSGSTVSYNAFTGSHYGLIDQNYDQVIEEGMLVSMTGNNNYYHNDPESEIIYGLKTTSRANDPKVIGVYSGPLEPNYGSGIDNPDLIMAVGNGRLWVSDSGEDIEIGDYLISSNIPGHAMKNSDEFSVAYIIARAAEPVNWDKVYKDIDGKKHKQISVLFESFIYNNELAAIKEQLKILTRELKALKTESSS